MSTNIFVCYSCRGLSDGRPNAALLWTLCRNFRMGIWIFVLQGVRLHVVSVSHIFQRICYKWQSSSSLLWYLEFACRQCNICQGGQPAPAHVHLDHCSELLCPSPTKLRKHLQLARTKGGCFLFPQRWLVRSSSWMKSEDGLLLRNSAIIIIIHFWAALPPWASAISD